MKARVVLQEYVLHMQQSYPEKREEWLRGQELVKMAMEQCKYENEVAQLKEEKRLRMQAYYIRERNQKAWKKVKPRALSQAKRVLQPLPEC